MDAGSSSFKHAVDAGADAQAAFERFDVDVGGAGFDGARNQRVDEADDRGFAGAFAQAREVGLGDFLDVLPCPARLRGVGAGIEAAEGFFDVGGDGCLDLHAQARCEAQGVAHVGVQRVGECDGQRVFGGAQRHGAGVAQEAFADGVGQDGLEREVVGHRGRNREGCGEGRDEFAFRHEAEFEEDFRQARLAVFQHARRALGVVRVEAAGAAQVRDQALFSALLFDDG